MLGTGGGSSDGGLEALGNLAAALADPVKLKAAIDQFKAAEAAAKAAQAEAAVAQKAARDEQAKAAAATAALNAKAAQQTAIAESNTKRTAQLDAATIALKAAQDAFSARQADADKANAQAKADIETREKALAISTANANAALDERAKRLKSGEDALADARRAYEKDKASLDARVAKIQQAVS